MSDLTKLREAANEYFDDLEASDITLEQISNAAADYLENTKKAAVTFRDVLLKNGITDAQVIDDVLPKLIQMAIDCGNINAFPNLLVGTKD